MRCEGGEDFPLLTRGHFGEVKAAPRLVKEVFQGQTVWEGEVEVFNIRGHPRARRCYSWAHATGEDDKGKRYVAVLELPPVDSAQKAVRAAIVEEVRKNTNNH